MFNVFTEMRFDDSELMLGVDQLHTFLLTSPYFFVFFEVQVITLAVVFLATPSPYLLCSISHISLHETYIASCSTSV